MFALANDNQDLSQQKKPSVKMFVWIMFCKYIIWFILEIKKLLHKAFLIYYSEEHIL